MINDIAVYAPVLIPTLCRYEHFTRCLSSLEECTGANETEVFIALDFPLKDEHRDGYMKIFEFLKKKEENNGFKYLHVIKREKNYGIGAGGNCGMARKDILLNFDRIIISEDDNVFSPNFLEYINKGLERFKDDKSIFAVCGYTHPYNIRYMDNNYFFQNVDFSAWGYGVWKEKFELCLEKKKKAYFYSKMIHPKNFITLYRQGLNRLWYSLALAFRNGDKYIPFTDNTISIYMALEKINVVMPVVTKVRNEGWDGTGQNCKTSDTQLNNAHNLRMIDKERNFDFKGNGMNLYEENRKAFVRQSYAHMTWIHFIKSLIKDLITNLGWSK